MKKTLLTLLGLFAFATLLTFSGQSKSVNAQAPDADPGELLIVKTCETETGSPVTYAPTFDLEVDVEFDFEIFVDVLDDEDDFFDVTASLSCGGTPTSVDLTDLIDFAYCNLTGSGYSDTSEYFCFGDFGPGFCGQFDFACGYNEIDGVSIDLSEILPAGVTAAFGGDCPSTGILGLLQPVTDSEPTTTPLGDLLVDTGLVCTIENTFDQPDLTITKICPTGNSTPASTFTVAVSGITTPGAVTCGGTPLVVNNVPVGSVTVTETIAGTGVFASAIACDGAAGVNGTMTTVDLTYGDDVDCTIVNVVDLDLTDGVPPTPPVILPGGTVQVGPIVIIVPVTVDVDVDNTNTNTSSNTSSNSNSTSNTNTTTNSNSNSQTQTNSQTQNSGQDQNATASGGSAVSPNAVLGAGGPPEVAQKGAAVRPPNTGDAGLVSTSDSSAASTYAIGGVFALVLAGLGAFKAVRR